MSEKIKILVFIILLISLGLSIIHLSYIWKDYSNLDNLITYKVDSIELVPELESKEKYKIKLEEQIEKNFDKLESLTFNLKKERVIKEKKVVENIKSLEEKNIHPLLKNNNDKTTGADRSEEKGKQIDEVKYIPEPPFILLAVSDQRDNSRGIVANETTGFTYIVKEGQRIDGYLVKRIKDNEITVSKGGQDFFINFQND